MITYQTDGVKMPTFSKRRINVWIREVAKKYNFKVGEIAYIFCSDEKILEINQEYLEHDYYTDIITFDYTEKKVISGDIFISLDTVKSNSEQFETDYETELYRILIHGILHLTGQKDKSPKDRAEMTKKEDEALGMLF